jgi:NADP-dependent 3-hydroxy acid dehydrogenase YdfG
VVSTDYDRVAVVIAGSSGGLGWSIATHLSECGVRVFASCHRSADTEECRTTAPDRLMLLVLDVLLPLMRRMPGCIVNISSIHGFLSVPFTGIYKLSKFVFEAVSNMQPECFATDIPKQSWQRWCKQRTSMNPAV